MSGQTDIEALRAIAASCALPDWPLPERTSVAAPLILVPGFEQAPLLRQLSLLETDKAAGGEGEEAGRAALQAMAAASLARPARLVQVATAMELVLNAAIEINGLEQHLAGRACLQGSRFLRPIDFRLLERILGGSGEIPLMPVPAGIAGREGYLDRLSSGRDVRRLALFRKRIAERMLDPAAYGAPEQEIAYVIREMDSFYSAAEARLWLILPSSLLAGEAAATLMGRGRLNEVLSLVHQLNDGVYL